jgi:hypothetical protein
MHGNNNFTKKDPLVNAVAKVMQENETRRQIEKQFQEEIGIQAKRELSFQQHAEYDRLLAERTAVALNEELKGNQTKIDANHNNKIDAQDFKILKAQKKQPQGADYAAQRRKERVASNGRMDEAEQIDELSKKTLGSYIKKASHDVATKSAATGRYAERANKVKDETKKGDYSNYQQGKKDDATADKMFGKSWKRRQGIAKATDKLTKEETINEISDKVKAAYARKADKEVTRTNTMGVAKRTGGVGIEDAKRKMDNRKAGIKRSMSEEETLAEKAPSGAKYERMVKHIKSKYSKGGLSDKEKSIAYATAWKAKNKDSE